MNDMAADVVGYSRLMGEDELGTLAALRAHRSELIAMHFFMFSLLIYKNHRHDQN